MTLIATPWSPGRWWRARRLERTVRAFTSAPTAPVPVPGHVVHDVTASWGATAGRGTAWTLRFGASGPSTTVERLAEAEADARTLVAAALGVSVSAVRVRIVPHDRAVETVAALRRPRGARRPVWRRGPRQV